MTNIQQPAIGEPGGPALVLYDGDCVLCSSWFRFVAERDHARRFMFTPIQSEFGRELAMRLGIDPVNPQTNAVIMDSKAYIYSDSALVVLSQLPRWQWTGLLRAVPASLRHPLYRLVARNRYRWFGRHAQCDLGGAQYRDRVIG